MAVVPEQPAYAMVSGVMSFTGNDAMTLQSMTGFARIDGGDAHCTWYWELRTVNSKGLDVRARLPSGHDALEPKVRQACTARLRRGNCNVNLFIQRESGDVGVRLNEDVLADAMQAAERAAEVTGLAKPTLDTVLGIRGVLDVSEAREDEETKKARLNVMMVDLDRALDAIVDARTREGERLKSNLAAQVDEIESLTTNLATAPGRSIEEVRAKFETRLEKLLVDKRDVDPHRLHQEIALLATKADIEEEIARLQSHVTAARELLEQSEPVGRQLDFLSQEFNREANTVCSKANHENVTKIGMQLKTVIDQFREQVQNIE